MDLIKRDESRLRRGSDQRRRVAATPRLRRGSDQRRRVAATPRPRRRALRTPVLGRSSRRRSAAPRAASERGAAAPDRVVRRTASPSAQRRDDPSVSADVRGGGPDPRPSARGRRDAARPDAGFPRYDPGFAKWVGSGDHFAFANQPGAALANYGTRRRVWRREELQDELPTPQTSSRTISPSFGRRTGGPLFEDPRAAFKIYPSSEFGLRAQARSCGASRRSSTTSRLSKRSRTTRTPSSPRRSADAERHRKSRPLRRQSFPKPESGSTQVDDCYRKKLGFPDDVDPSGTARPSLKMPPLDARTCHVVQEDGTHIPTLQKRANALRQRSQVRLGRSGAASSRCSGASTTRSSSGSWPRRRTRRRTRICSTSSRAPPRTSGRAEILPVRLGFAMAFKRTAPVVQRCQNQRKRRSYGRDRTGARRYGDVAEETRAALEAWVRDWRAEATDGAAARLNAANPKFILREWMLVDAYDAAGRGDFAPARELHDLVKTPFCAARARRFVSRAAGSLRAARRRRGRDRRLGPRRRRSRDSRLGPRRGAAVAMAPLAAAAPRAAAAAPRSRRRLGPRRRRGHTTFSKTCVRQVRGTRGSLREILPARAAGRAQPRGHGVDDVIVVSAARGPDRNPGRARCVASRAAAHEAARGALSRAPAPPTRGRPGSHSLPCIT